MPSLRYFLPDHVYIAGSHYGRVVKIGMTKNPRRRQQNLRNRRYGGLRDWAILYYARAGRRIETETLWRLRRHLTLESWQSESWGNATEIVRCSFSEAHEALSDLISDEEQTKAWWSPHWCNYLF
jgi:hypothetical protein